MLVAAISAPMHSSWPQQLLTTLFPAASSERSALLRVPTGVFGIPHAFMSIALEHLAAVWPCLGTGASQACP